MGGPHVNTPAVLLYGRGTQPPYPDRYVTGHVYWSQRARFLRVKPVLADLLSLFDLFSWGVNR